MSVKNNPSIVSDQQQLQSIVLPKRICDFFNKLEPRDMEIMEMILREEVYSHIYELTQDSLRTKVLYDDVLFHYMAMMILHSEDIDSAQFDILSRFSQILTECLVFQKGGVNE